MTSRPWSASLLQELARKHGTPFYVYSEDALRKRAKALRDAARGVPLEIFYATKANSNSALLRILREEGLGADVVSGGELKKALRAGFRARDVVFSGVGKTREELAHALRAGVKSINVESEAELRALHAVARDLGKTAAVSLRFNPDIDAKTHPHITTGLRDNKFGMNAKAIRGVLSDTGAFPRIRFRGLSMHIGSQIIEIGPVKEAFRQCKALLAWMRARLPGSVDFVDLGGGVGIPYRGEKTISLPSYMREVKRHFAEFWEADPRFRVGIEPGRLLVAQAGALATRVLYVKRNPHRSFLVVDAGMNDFLRPSLYEGYHAIENVSRGGGGRGARFDVVGPVCESADFLGRGRLLPKGTEAGDLLLVRDAGAYGFSMASQYNERCRVAEILVGRRGARLVRRRETFRDLIRHELP